jgi:zinc protease
MDMPRIVSRADPKVTQENVQITWLVPSYNRAEPGEAEALDLLAETVAGGPTSPLYRDLVIDKKLATSVGLYYQSSAWDMGQFSAYAVPAEGVTLEQMHAELLAAIDRAVTTGIADVTVARAKARLEAATIYAQDSQSAMARIFGTGLVTGATVEELKTWPARVRAVTVDQVRAAATRLDPDSSVTGYLRRAAAEQRS